MFVWIHLRLVRSSEDPKLLAKFAWYFALLVIYFYTVTQDTAYISACMTADSPTALLESSSHFDHIIRLIFWSGHTHHTFLTHWASKIYRHRVASRYASCTHRMVPHMYIDGHDEIIGRYMCSCRNWCRDPMDRQAHHDNPEMTREWHTGRMHRQSSQYRQ